MIKTAKRLHVQEPKHRRNRMLLRSKFEKVTLVGVFLFVTPIRSELVPFICVFVP